MFLDYFKQDTTSSVSKAISGNISAQQLTVMRDYARTNFDYVSIMIGRNDLKVDNMTKRGGKEVKTMAKCGGKKGGKKKGGKRKGCGGGR